MRRGLCGCHAVSPWGFRGLFQSGQWLGLSEMDTERTVPWDGSALKVPDAQAEK